MSNEIKDKLIPPWDQEDIFPLAPDSSEYGFMSASGKLKGCSQERLLEICGPNITLSKAILVWTPDDPRLVPPGKVSFLKEQLYSTNKSNIRVQMFSSIAFSLLIGGGLVSSWGKREFLFYAAFFVMVGILPLIQSIRGLWNLKAQNKEEKREDGKELRYVAWIQTQSKLYSNILVPIIVIIFLLQIIVGLESSVELAGLTKSNTLKGEYFRILTGPLLHGNFIHLAFNVMALGILGAYVESLVGRGCFSITFLLSMISGSMFSIIFLPNTPSVGASGGIIGLLGFLLVYSFKYREYLPTPLFSSLLRSSFFIVLIGGIAYQYIDNAAHGGGMVAGTVSALLLIPKDRMIPLGQSRFMKFIGIFSFLLVLAFGVLTIVLLIK